MIIKDAQNKVVEISQFHWPLAVDLFMKWGHTTIGNEIDVVDVDDITPELSAWGIPWKRKD